MILLVLKESAPHLKTSTHHETMKAIEIVLSDKPFSLYTMCFFALAAMFAIWDQALFYAVLA